MFHQMTSDWEDTPKKVEECIDAEMKDEVKNKLNQCLTKQKVPIVKEMPEGIDKHLTEIFRGNKTKKIVV